MKNTLDAVIERLQDLRKEVGGDATVRIRETPVVEPGYRHAIDDIRIGKLINFSPTPKEEVEVVIVPYLAP